MGRMRLAPVSQQQHRLRQPILRKKLPVPEGHSPHDAIDHKDRIKEQQAWLNGKSNTGLEPSPSNLPNVLGSHHSVFIGKWNIGGHGVETLQPATHGFDEVLWYLDRGASLYAGRKSGDKENAIR